jgi:anti-sigma B factor antagonist
VDDGFHGIEAERGDGRERDGGIGAPGAGARASYSRFACSVRMDADVAVLAPRGELDLAGAVTFDAAVKEVVARGTARVVVDLSELTFMDSSGMRAVLRLHAQLSDGCRLELLPGSPAVQRIFELTGMSEALPFRARS